MCHLKNGGLPCNHHKIKQIENGGGEAAVVVICTILSYVLFHPLFIACTCQLSS